MESIGNQWIPLAKAQKYRKRSMLWRHHNMARNDGTCVGRDGQMAIVSQTSAVKLYIMITFDIKHDAGVLHFLHSDKYGRGPFANGD